MSQSGLGSDLKHASSNKQVHFAWRLILLSLLTTLSSCGKTGPHFSLASAFGPNADTDYAGSDLFVAINDSVSGTVDTYYLLVSAPAGVDRVTLCQAPSTVDCSPQAAGYSDTRFLANAGNRKVFKTDRAVNLTPNVTFAISAYQGSTRKAASVVNSLALDNPATNPGGTTEQAKPLELGSAPTQYLELSEIKTLLTGWAAKDTKLMKFQTYATVNGEPAMYLRVSSSVNDGKDRPKVLIDAATHGDESISTATILGFMHKFLSGYGKDQTITKLIQTRDIYFVPVVCPDGYSNFSRQVEGRDPNRSFPSPTNPGRTSATCAQEIANLINRSSSTRRSTITRRDAL